MKNLLKLLSLFTVAVLIFSSCEGPMGPAGADGKDGLDGAPGQNGQDANATCTECHKSDQVITSRMAQWAASTHATGGNAERNGAECAPCHTSQGFLEANTDGAFTTAPGLIEINGAISNPNQQNCYTCHEIHDTYTDDDWGLTKTAATVASHSVDGTTPVSVNLGTANQCTGCHQGRALSNVLDMTDNVSTITATSYRWGLHHGPQYNVIIGKTLYEFDGSVDYPTAENHMTDKTNDACIDCHMGEAYGTQAGGHTMNVGYDYHGNLISNLPASCITCHIPDGSLDLDAKMEALQTEVTAMLSDLGAALETAGVKKPATPTADNIYINYTGSGATQVIPPQTEMMLAAFTNFQAITEDRSMGMHNPAYVKALLKNTLEAVVAATPPPK